MTTQASNTQSASLEPDAPWFEREDTDVAKLSERPLPAPPPAFVVRAAMALRKLLLRCADAVVPAEVALLDRTLGLAHTYELGAVARLRIADLLQAGPQTAHELVRRTGSDADALHRALRSLASQGIFNLDAEGRFSNNRTSRTLCSDRLGSVRAFVEHFTLASNCAAWADLARTIATGRSAFARVHGVSQWQWFATHPDEEELFARAMMSVTLPDVPFIAALYPFNELKQLCDVGGGRGTLLSELVLRNPQLRGVLYEASGVIASAQPLLAKRGVMGRIDCVAGDFFERVPGGYEAYLLKHVLHDWDDRQCKLILSNVRRAVPAHGRLLLVEWLVERNDANERTSPIDVYMMVACDEGRERSRAEFEALLAASGFHLARVFEGPTCAVLEARPN